MRPKTRLTDCRNSQAGLSQRYLTPVPLVNSWAAALWQSSAWRKVGLGLAGAPRPALLGTVLIVAALDRSTLERPGGFSTVI